MSKVFDNLKGLADEWEAVKSLRNRVKDLGGLVVEAPGEDDQTLVIPAGIVARTVENAKLNHEVLLPVFQKMKGEYDKVPELPALVSCIQKLMTDHSRVCSRKFLQDQAWSIRYLFGVVKHNIYKPAPPRESWHHKFPIFFWNALLVFGITGVKTAQDPILLALLHAYGCDATKWKQHAQPYSKKANEARKKTGNKNIQN